MQQFYYGGSINFDEILQNLLKLSGKEEEFQQEQSTKKKTVERKFEEITS